MPGAVARRGRRDPSCTSTDDSAALTHDQVGNDLAGWVNYQPLYEQIIREQPDLFE